MANTLNDLYLKYVNKVGSVLEKDRYFQYLFAITQAGKTTLQQRNKVLHKVVDEKWLGVIEDSLDALSAVTDRPRRFVQTCEEVVPVELAKQITADSVRHLSRNTQYIQTDDEGNIHPSQILSVTLEDSYDLYENRFIYHLIQRLVTFVDKRTDLIFWSTGDETVNTLCMESSIDDAYETIEYKLEMRIKNLQSYVENDSDNMQVFLRIDRVRRLVMALKNSSFCKIMAGCAKVRSPIQRTNLLMKDPEYRKCYQLWQFLESYDSLGYTIEEQDRALSFDEEYIIQLQTGLIANYSIFKSILERDERDLTALATKRRRVLKPKFLKRVEEQIVDDYSIEDVEIRKVIIEEVTQAQLDAEARSEADRARAEAAEQRCSAAMRQAEEAYAREQNAIDAQRNAENTAQQAITAKENAEATLAKAIRTQQEVCQAAEEAKQLAEQRALEREAACIDMEQRMKDAQAAMAQAKAEQKEAEKERTAAEKQMLSDRIVSERARESELRAMQARKAAEERLRESEVKVRENAKAAHDFEKKLAEATRRLQNATEAAATAKEEKKEALTRCKAAENATVKAQEKLSRTVAQYSDEQLARKNAEERIAQLSAELERAQAACAEAERRLEEATFGELLRNAIGARRKK